MYNVYMRKDDELIKRLQEVELETKIHQILKSKAREFEVPDRSYGGAIVYYPGEILPLDGDSNNKAFGNLAMVCPRCRAHILLSRFNPEGIWLLKARGLSNADVGRFLGISRERVRQLCKKYEALQESEIVLLEADLDGLVKRAQAIDDSLKTGYSKDKDGFPIKGRRKRGKRLIDRRTLRKRIIAELDKLKAKEAQNERQHTAKRQE